MADIAINDIDPLIPYTAAGGETGYSFPFPIFDSGDLIVVEILSDGTETTLIEGTDYSVSGVGVATGGSITFDLTRYPSGATANARYVLYRDLAVARSSDFLTGGDFKAETVNRELDKLVMMIQQNELDIKRSVGLLKTDAEDEIKLEDQTAAVRAGKIMAFGDNGNTLRGVTPASIELSDIDTAFSGLASGDFLRYNGTAFSNITLATLRSSLNLAQDNFAATAAPTVNNDSSQGYSIGSRWYDGTNDNMYHCLDATVGAAVWTQGDVVPGDLGAMALLNIATQLEAETGTANDRGMTPLRSKQQFDALIAAQGNANKDQLIAHISSTGTVLKDLYSTVDTASRDSTGTFDINFDFTMEDANYIVEATILGSSTRNRTISVTNQTTTSCRVLIAAATNANATDEDFGIVVKGNLA